MIHLEMRPPSAAAVFLLGLILSMPIAWIGCSGDRGHTILAEVNGQKITLSDFQRELEGLPEETRSIYQQRPEALLQRLIGTAILLQEAKARGFVQSSELDSLKEPEVRQALVKLMDQVTQSHKVSEDEVLKFYEAHKEALEGRPFSEMKEPLLGMLMALRKQEIMESFIQGLVAKAKITTYKDRLPEPPPPVFPSSSPQQLEEALKSGRPTLVDFGSDFCGPCIRLRPVLKALKEAHEGRINVLYVDVDRHKDLASRYRVKFLPTLVFFNQQGMEVNRKMGYMERAALERIMAQLGFIGKGHPPS